MEEEKQQPEIEYTNEQYKAAIKALGDSIGLMIVAVNNAVYLGNQALTSLAPFREMIVESYKAWAKANGVEIDIKEEENMTLVQDLFRKLNPDGDEGEILM